MIRRTFSIVLVISLIVGTAFVVSLSGMHRVLADGVLPGAWSSNGPQLLAGGPGSGWGAIRSLVLSPNFSNDHTIFAGG